MNEAAAQSAVIALDTARPAGLYRVTQGLHVATGLSAIPILLAKLWVVYPRFWEWPPLHSVAHAIERVSLLPLVGGALFMLVTGTINIARWYSPRDEETLLSPLSACPNWIEKLPADAARSTDS